MAETQAATEKKATASKKSNLSRRTLRTQGRKKRKEKLAGDQEFAKAYFDAKSKRSADKKVAYRKRHAKKA